MAKTRIKSGKTRSPRPQPGDAFLMPLGDGRFGFCHVIHVPSRVFGSPRRGWVDVETSSWIGEEAPDLNDPRLREPLVQTHHGNGPNIWRVVVSGPPPDTFRRLGTIEPDRTAHACCCWTQWESLAREVLTQWRWDHDREALLAEEQAAVRRRKAEQSEIAK